MDDPFLDEPRGPEPIPILDDDLDDDPSETNPVGNLGLIIGIVAIFTGGVLSPLALTLCLIALMRRPRLTAMLGLGVSGLGLLLFLDFFLHDLILLRQ